MKHDKKRVVKELEDMIARHVIESIEVDVAAEEIYKKFIEPLVLYNEIKENEKA